jgi:aminopeptidase
MEREELLRRYAEVAIRVGVNLEPGQELYVGGDLAHAPLVREIVRQAYAAGARYVRAEYGDQHVRRAMIEHADLEVLQWTPPYDMSRLEHLRDVRAARIQILGDPEPNLLADLDPERVGRARPLEAADFWRDAVGQRTVAWCVVAQPTEGWAEAVFGSPDVGRLWGAVAAATRLDADDPVGAWWEQVERLGARARAMTSRGFTALRYRGPGTDLEVGLIPGSVWVSADFETAWGRRHVPNLPTEEVFTTPDHRRTNGVVTSTRPLVLSSEGTVVEGLRIRFEDGCAVEVDADRGAEVVRAQMAVDEQAAYLGEVALVDSTSAVGRTGVTFRETLFDENATSHIAYGAGFAFNLEGAAAMKPAELMRAGINVSRVHTDFMVGGPEVDILGVTEAGEEVPVIVGDAWQLDEPGTA